MKQALIAAALLGAGLTQAAQDRIAREFAGGYGQVEVGGPYAGAEFHGSRPLPSRISFYEPAANSIDMSTDYWKRAESAPFDVGVRVNGGAARHIGREAWTYTLSPHRVEFRRTEDVLRWTSRFEFFRTLPGMVWTLTCENLSPAPMTIDLLVRCRTVVRTCQTYAWMDSAWTAWDGRARALEIHCDRPQARRACFVFQNLGEQPSAWTSAASDPGPDSTASAWFDAHSPLGRRLLSPGDEGSAAAAFAYRKSVAPGGGRLVVRLAIMSVAPGGVKPVEHRAALGWKKDLDAYDAFIRDQLKHSPRTGDPVVDRTSDWSCAILGSNAHSLEGHVVPMPCPAEYNFFFTHDVLLTDLAAAWFDAPRVKRDLGTIASLAQGEIIPHARYWRDDGFKTELCTPDNWNHLWFIETVARYTRHTGDTATAARLFPLVAKSLREVLTQRHADSLMYAYRPDWWDIGHREGPRSYITILAIRALRDYLYLASTLRRDLAQLGEYEALADGMERALNDRLWDARAAYLMNANGTDPDEHVYMGSLMADVYGELPAPRSDELLATARLVLLDRRIGIRNVMPPDFHTDSMRAYFRFPTNEAGDPYFYANGGVWAHANAWYAEGLAATGHAREALGFLKTVMTIDGVESSPRGQPAMYEYRYADPASPEYGAIDKPSFLWAGGMYLGAVYALIGFRENVWNIAAGDGAASGCFDSAAAIVEFGGVKNARLSGGGSRSTRIDCGGIASPSCVMPLDIRGGMTMAILRGGAGGPCLSSVNAVLRSCRPAGSGFRAVLSSFDGHAVRARVVSAASPSRVLLDGTPVVTVSSVREGDGAVVTTIDFAGTLRPQVLEVR
ncbi:MAG TPA: hypothetical protein VL221_13605 [Bacteroidota bacterium]|nr:hypothetical protein [Bacteroidota bacterium]